MPGSGRPATLPEAGFRHNRAAWRLALVVMVLLTEYLIFATLLDIDTLSALPDPFRLGSRGVAGAMSAVLAALLAALLFWRDRILAELAHASRQLGGWDVHWLGVHLLAVVALAMATGAIVRMPDATLAAGTALMALWVMAGSLMSFALFRAALAGALAGLALRLSGVAVAAGVAGMLAALIPPLVAPLWSDLAVPTLYLTAVLLALSGQTVMIDPAEAIIELDGFAVQIYGPCSGLEGMGLVALFLTGYLWRFRADHCLPRALLILPAGIVLAFLANGLRIALLTMIGAYVDPAIAAGAFHSKAGWIFFCVLTIGLVAIARSVPWFRAGEGHAGAGSAADNPTADFLLPFLAWLAVGLLASAWVAGTDPFYPLRVLAVLPVLWLCRHGIAAGLRARESEGGTPGAALAPWVIGLLVAALWLLLPGEPAATGGVRRAANAEGWTMGFMAVWLAFRLVGTVMIVPVVEELAFRGYLQRRLIAANFTEVPLDLWRWGAVLASAAAFGAMHGHVLAGTFAGIGFSVAMHLRGRLGDAVIAHGTANAVLALWVLGFGRWDLW